MLQRGGIDVMLVDAIEDTALAVDTAGLPRDSGIALVVLMGEDRPTIAGLSCRAQVVRRPVDLAAVPSESPFSQALIAAVLQKTNVAARPVTTSVPPRVRISRAGLPELIAIGSSTGGPQALPQVIGPMFNRVRQPIVITQHMPPAFTQLLAEHLQRSTSFPTVQASDGMPLLPGRVHIAPGGRHLLFARRNEGVVCVLDDGPPENFCKPAVDPMLRSITDLYGGKVIAVILTGMGHDGLEGCRSLVAAGGTVLAQDEATSVVWGMPGAVAQAGLCEAVLPVSGLGEKVVAMAGGRP
jgi:two-component system chemotaxis response regulator CheB